MRTKVPPPVLEVQEVGQQEVGQQEVELLDEDHEVEGEDLSHQRYQQ